MLVPLSWLRDFAPFGNDVDVLVETCNALGLVVEGVERVGAGIADVVVAKVLEVDRIEGADKIRRIVVDHGDGPVQVVCGAWNFEAGATVAFAPVGAVLPGDFAIGKRKMKGVESNGMICSERELELGDDGAGIMLLDGALTPGTPLVDALGVEPDVVLDLAIEGNRPDALCMLGVARDLAAKLGLPFSEPSPAMALPAPAGDGPSVVVDAPALCPIFTATRLDNVAIGPSPDWIQRRLTLAGMRPISNIVDISNYVMLEHGQPTHPYDADRLPGGGFVVRQAAPGEQLLTLDGENRTLGDGEDCVIADGNSVGVGIAGIMGGGTSEIHDGTSSVILEAAWFEPMVIARTSKRLGLRSEASARFEKGVDAGNVERAVARFCALAVEFAGATVGPRTVFASEEFAPKPAVITLRTSKVNALLGTELDAATVDGYLSGIGFRVDRTDDETAQATAPSWRPDATIEEALVEEVARHYGYESIPRTLRSSPGGGGLTRAQRERRVIKDILCGLGINEAMGSPLLGPGDHAAVGLSEDNLIKADRPLVLEESILRTSLLPGLMRSLSHNVRHRAADVRLFEIGATWRRPDEPPAELVGHRPPRHRTVGRTAPRNTTAGRRAVAGRRLHRRRHLDGAGRRVAAREARGGERHRTGGRAAPDAHGHRHCRRQRHRRRRRSRPGGARRRSASSVAWRGSTLTSRRCRPRPAVRPSPSTSAASRRATSTSPSSSRTRLPPATCWPRSVRPPATCSSRRNSSTSTAAAGVPEGNRSLAFSLRFCALDRTLTDAEVGERRAACIAAVEKAHRATLRG